VFGAPKVVKYLFIITIGDKFAFADEGAGTDAHGPSPGALLQFENRSTLFRNPKC